MSRKCNLLIAVVLLAVLASSCGSCSHTGRRAEFERRNRDIKVDRNEQNDDSKNDSRHDDDVIDPNSRIESTEDY